MLNERTYPTPDSGLTHLFTRSRTVVAYTVVHLVTPDCTRGVIDPLYHCRHNDRDRQCESDRGIIMVVEFCRGELISRDGIVRHWTMDDTDLFTGGDLLYCGGCCGQHIVAKICNKQLLAGYNKPLQVQGNTVNIPGSGCDSWIDCFVYQCKVCLLLFSAVYFWTRKAGPKKPV